MATQLLDSHAYGRLLTLRDLTDAALIDMREGVDHYVHNGKAHKGAVKAAFSAD